MRRFIAPGGVRLTPYDPRRRQFLTFSAASLALASLTAKAQAPLPAGPKELSPETTPELPSTTLTTASDTTHRLTVNVHIDGLGPYRFLVDTGADRSVVAAEVAAAIGLPFDATVTLRGVVRAIATQSVLIGDLSFGSVRYRNLLAPTLPAALLGADGYLGLDALDGHRVIFDFKHHTIHVTAPRSRLAGFWAGPSEARIHAAGKFGHLRAVNCSADGIAATAFIDTGAEVSAGNTALLNALKNRDPRRESLGTISLTDVTGSAISGIGTMIRTIQLNEVTFTNCPLVVADFEVFEAWGLSDRPALLIGVNFLQQFASVSIDYGLKEIRFDLGNA